MEIKIIGVSEKIIHTAAIQSRPTYSTLSNKFFYPALGCLPRSGTLPLLSDMGLVEKTV